MKILCICQYPTQHIHRAWVSAICTDRHKWMYYIPIRIIKNKFLNKIIWYNPVINQLVSLMRTFNLPAADVYIVDGFKAALPAILNKSKDKKIILINSDTFFSNYPKQNVLVRWIYRWYIKHIDCFICTSQLMVDYASLYSQAPKKIVYPFYDEMRFKNASCDISSTNICSISTAKLGKRPDIMIAAFNRFRELFPESQLFVCDGGTYGGEGIDACLEFIRKQPSVVTPGLCNPIPYLRQSGLYINTSAHESFGVNILEAMRAGIPPVVSKFCGAKDLVEQADPSLICDLDPEEFGEKLIKLQKNTKWKQELGRKCRSIALKHTKPYSMNEFKKTVYSIIEEINTVQNKHT